MSVRVSSDLLRADMPVGGVAGSENYSGASAAGSPAVDSNNLNDHDDESGELDARRPRSPLPDRHIEEPSVQRGNSSRASVSC